MSTTHAKFGSVGELRRSILAGGNLPQEYVDKMMHQVPDLPTVKDRAAYLVEKAKGLSVLDLGCTGAISPRIKEAAREYHGVDITPGEGRDVVDLDHRPDLLAVYDGIDLIIASELLEHLANPGYFLLALKEKYRHVPKLLTVPNAGAYVVKDDCEMVHRDHVCWYSYTTLKTLLSRYQYEILEARWYNSPADNPYRSEGLIVRTV